MEVSPPTTANMLVQAASAATPGAREEQPHNLHLHQMIRATVQESGQDKALLQFGDRRLWVATGSPLKAGDTLNLQVMDAGAKLSFKIIEPNLLERLGQSLHLLDKHLDVQALLPAMIAGKEPGANLLGQPVRDGLAQLLSLLQSPPEQLKGEALSALPRQLGLYHEANLQAGSTEVGRGTLKNALGQLSEAQHHLRGELKAHLKPLWAAIERFPERMSTTEATEKIAAVLRPLQQLAEAGAQSALSRPQVAAAVREFVTALRQYLQPFAALSNDAVDRFEQQAALLPQIMQGPFDQALAAIGQKAHGNNLLEALFLLLRGTPERLAGTDGKQISRQLVETLQKGIEQGLDRIEKRPEDALRQLELWQLCQVRLSDSDTSFVPLPLPFLDNGFLIARRQPSPDSETEAPEDIVSVSLFLDLQKLGPLQIDLLYQKEELFVRFKCGDQAAADFVSAARSELGEDLGEIRLATIAVSTGAESPDRALIQKLIPPEKGLLDARI